ncbi:hypothetical protein L596_015366 [Steinernema carpocapsae]|uniref:Choline transporter-like protein n=1 Tax=Steinernema carpocapsae TaxID=34508 RepID=A0A4U5NFM7_STECR|nr:hypothetical protein L596_015366 [Steinernema carpocapsae]
MIFIVGWGFIAAYGFKWGKPERIIHPTDDLGRICGTHRPGFYDLRSKPYLFIFDLSKCFKYSTVLAGCQTPQICVEECPKKFYSYLGLQTVPSEELRDTVNTKVVCKDLKTKKNITSFKDLRQAVEHDQCVAYTVPSTPMYGRCVPNMIANIGDTLDTVNNGWDLDKLVDTYGKTYVGDNEERVPTERELREVATVDHFRNPVNQKAPLIPKLAHDLSVSWWQMVALLLIAAVVSFVWILVLRLFGGFMIWASILMLLLVLVAGSGYSWYRYVQLSEIGAINDYSFQPDFKYYLEMPRTWLILGIIASVLLAIMFVIICFVRSRIRLATKLITETSKALGHMTSTLFFPLVPFVMQICVFILTGSIAIWLATAGEELCTKRIASVLPRKTPPSATAPRLPILTAIASLSKWS